ncbi:MAG: hypothetical protein ACI9XZ_004540 [Alphaproteobacteria bacterium]|jgi:hypothetical protein
MYTTKLIAAVAAIAFTAIGMQGAQAAPRDGGYSGRNVERGIVNFRIRKQTRRIRRAQRRGRLDWVEARRARFELSHIRGFRARYLRDGRLNRREARHLHRLLDQNGRRIRRMARNDRRNWRRGRQARFDQFRDRRNFNARPIAQPRLSRFNGFH